MLVKAILQRTKVFKRHESVKHTFILFFGKAGAQLIGLLSMPILARFYSPDQFGQFALLNSLLAIVLVAASARYEAGIVLAKRPLHAKLLFQLAQFILTCFAILLAICLFFRPGLVNNWMAKNEFPSLYVWLLPLLVLCCGYWQIVQNWLIRFTRYKQISLGLIIQRFLVFSGALFFAIIPFTENGLVFGLVLGSVAIFGIAVYYQRHSFRIPDKSLLVVAHHFREFPLFSVPSIALILLIQHLPVFWISHFFDSSLTGAYSIAFTLVMIPVTALNTSAGHVFHERLARTRASNRSGLILRLCSIYSVLLLPLSVVIWLAGKEIVTLVLGSAWQEAGTISSLLAPVIFCQGIVFILTSSLAVYRKQGRILIIQLFRLFLLGLALWSGLYFHNAHLTFTLIGVFSILHLFMAGVLTYPSMLSRSDTAIKPVN